MQLQFDNTTTVDQLEAQFARQFSFLKLEVFRFSPVPGSGAICLERADGTGQVSKLTTPESGGLFLFNTACPVAYFEQAIQKEWGLMVKVYRRSGGAWLETDQTNHLSLQKQEGMGAALQPARFNIHSLFL